MLLSKCLPPKHVSVTYHVIEWEEPPSPKESTVQMPHIVFYDCINLASRLD